LLADPVLAERMGARAYERAHREFLGDSHLEHYAALFASMLPARRRAAPADADGK
jgi:hypothetical protein